MDIQNYSNEIQTEIRELLMARSSMSDSYIGICKDLVEKAKDLDDINLLGYSYYYLADACYDLSTEYTIPFFSGRFAERITSASAPVSPMASTPSA